MNESFIFLADGFEEIEALATVDILRRAGMAVKTVSINDGFDVSGAHGITVKADMLLNDVAVGENTEWLICPGGMPGAANLAANKKLTEMLCTQNRRGGKIAAICASPALVLAPIGLLKDKQATCYPGMEPTNATGTKMTGQPVVTDGNIVTGKGPAFTFDFALAIVKESKGSEAAETVAHGMLYNA